MDMLRTERVHAPVILKRAEFYCDPEIDTCIAEKLVTIGEMKIISEY